jgi:Activator of Hsp90 ATPase homolog 1-like protein
MGDYAIRAQFEASCSPQQLQDWLDSPAGIAGWWSDKVEGAASAVGDTFHVTFPTSPVVFELEVKSISESALEWYVAQNPPWWKGTTIGFEFSTADGNGARMVFTHSGFDPGDPIIQVITPAWVRFLDNLVAVAESGRANPAVVN